MKKQLLKLMALPAALLCAMPALASVEVDGIFYELDSTNAQATVCASPNLYAGNVVVPASVSYDGVDYTVFSVDYGTFAN